jgi:hypothetical protein
MIRRPPGATRSDWWALPRETRRQLVKGLLFMAQVRFPLLTEHGRETARRYLQRCT